MSWIDYNEEYELEALNERARFYESMQMMTEATKEGVFKDGYYLRDHLQIPHVSKELAKGKVRDSIVEFVAKFMDDHTTQLGTIGPVYIFPFAEKETALFYETFNLNDEKLVEMYNNTVQETYYGKISPIFDGWIKNAPHKLLFTAMLIEALQKDYQDIVECCEYLWAFCEYPLVYRISWSTGVKEDLMKYTIEHLGNKFKIKQMSNLKDFLKYDLHTSVTTHAERLKTGADNEYMDFVYRVRNSLKNKFVNIAKAYYENDKKNATQHTKSSTFEDGSLADQEGSTTAMTQIIDNTINKFSTAGVNNTIAKSMAEINNVDKDTLITFINQIWSYKDNKLYKLVEDIITAYFEKYPTSISLTSMEFVNFGLKLYKSIGTSANPLYADVKSIMKFWMDDIINIRQSYSSDNTIISYTRAIYNYVVFMINHYN